MELGLTICYKGANAITKNLMVQICDKPSDVASQIVPDPKRTEQMWNKMERPKLSMSRGELELRLITSLIHHNFLTQAVYIQIQGVATIWFVYLVTRPIIRPSPFTTAPPLPPGWTAAVVWSIAALPDFSSFLSLVCTILKKEVLHAFTTLATTPALTEGHNSAWKSTTNCEYTNSTLKLLLSKAVSNLQVATELIT
jgi:hypothetical protein